MVLIIRFHVTLTSIIIKFNGDIYRLWLQFFHVFIGTQNKLGIFLVDPQM